MWRVQDAWIGTRSSNPAPRKVRDMSTGQPSTALDVVIVNWNSGELLQHCVSAVAASSVGSQVRVIIVDNASTDGSEHGLEAPDLRVEVIRNAENRGFGAACNQGAACGDAPYLLFLNPDTRVGQDTFQRALDQFCGVEHAEVGVVGVRLVDDEGRTQRTCARRPTFWRVIARSTGLDRIFPAYIKPHFMTDWDHMETRDVDQVMGAFLMIRRNLFSRLGGFDERYFVYYEDVDLCLSARQAGARIIHFAGAEAWHKAGGSTEKVKDRRLFYMMRSEALFIEKWYGRGAATATLLAALAVQVPIRTGRALLSGKPGDALEVLRGGRLLLRDIPRLIARSRNVVEFSR